MGKSKQKEVKEKKFDRNVEISAPILDPEIIKQIHTPPKGQRLDIKHGGFKALLSDLNSQDSTDELMPLNDNHMPSYIGISCAVSGYSNYSSYAKKTSGSTTPKPVNTASTPNKSRTASPTIRNKQDHQNQVHHITIDKNNIHSIDEERKELTEKLTASATERKRSPSPCIPPTEDDRHHGAYVGARYCPLPPPSQLVNKHIPLLGIDDEQNPDELVEEENRVEQKIATLYGDEFVEDWRESMTHKAKKELVGDQQPEQSSLKNPKDLVTLKPTPIITGTNQTENQPDIDIPAPNVRVLANIEKQFLNKLLTDENPPTPTSQSTHHVTVATNAKPVLSPPLSPVKQLDDLDQLEIVQEKQGISEQPKSQPSPVKSPTPQPSPSMSPDSGDHQSMIEVNSNVESLARDEEHIEYEIRAQSPVDNNSSPVHAPHLDNNRMESTGQIQGTEGLEDGKLVSFSPEPLAVTETNNEVNDSAVHNLVSFSPEPTAELASEINPQETTVSNAEDKVPADVTRSELPQIEELEIEKDTSDALDLKQEESRVDYLEEKGVLSVDQQAPTDEASSAGGFHYLKLLESEKSFIASQIQEAESILVEKESELDDDTVGRIRSAIGKANLLINKKFNQFKELCEANINKKSDEQFATLNDDLAGFWDMLTIQVSDVRKSFETLWHAQESNWKTSLELTDEQQLNSQQESCKEMEDSSTRDKSSSSGNNKPKLSAQKDQKRREKLQEHINQMKQNQAAKSSSDNLSESQNTDTVEIDTEGGDC